MKLFINISNLVMGGSIQVAHSFLFELAKIKTSNKYLICANKFSIKNININSFSSNFKFVIISSSPVKFSSRLKVLKKLNLIANDFNPDIVFTLFGPSYWVPNAKHICGFADGWVYNPDSIVYSKLNFLSRLKRKLLNLVKTVRLKKEATHFILETEDAKNRLNKYLNIPKSKISVVSNTFNSVFNQKFFEEKIPPLFKNSSFKLISISSYYPHKNLEIINSVIDYIPKKYDIKFYLTLPEDIFLKKFKNCDQIINLGPQFIGNCPRLYYWSDAVFLPTLLETFSASYPEAMIMEKPIITSNLSFAKDICASSAEYFNPLDPEDIAKKILNLYSDKNRYNQLIEFGKKQVKIFPNPNERAKKYLSICRKQIIKNN